MLAGQSVQFLVWILQKEKSTLDKTVVKECCVYIKIVKSCNLAFQSFFSKEIVIMTAKI